MTSPNVVCRPAIFDSEPEHYIKEVHFFDHPDRYSQGIEFYAQRYANCQKHTYAMDATPDTMRHPEHVSDTYYQAGGLQHAELKIIINMRDPAARELSLYNHMLLECSNNPSSDEWYSIITSEDGSVMNFDDYVVNVVKPRITSMNEKGMTFYPNNIYQWGKHFARDQILVLNYDEVHLQPNSAQGRIRKFIDAEFPGELPVSNTNKSSSKVQEMSCATRDLLTALYRPQTEKFYEYLANKPGPEMEQMPFGRFIEAPCK